MFYLKIKDGVPVSTKKFTLSENYLDDNGDLILNVNALPLAEKIAIGLYPVVETLPEFDSRYQFLSVENYTIFDDYIELFYRVDVNREFLADLVQNRLDDWGKLKDFDGINDACSYFSSTISVWANEASHAIDMRDATWQSFYAQSSTNWEEIESLLPALNWG